MVSGPQDPILIIETPMLGSKEGDPKGFYKRSL